MPHTIDTIIPIFVTFKGKIGLFEKNFRLNGNIQTIAAIR